MPPRGEDSRPGHTHRAEVLPAQGQGSGLEPRMGLEGKTGKEEIWMSWGQNPVPSKQEGPGLGNQGRECRK